MEYIVTSIQNMGSVMGMYGAYKENIWFLGGCCIIYTIMSAYCGLFLLDVPAALYYAGIVYPNWMYVQELREARNNNSCCAWNDNNNHNDGTLDVEYNRCYETRHDLSPVSRIENGQGTKTDPVSGTSNNATIVPTDNNPPTTHDVVSNNHTSSRDGLMKDHNNNNINSDETSKSDNKKRWTRWFRK